MFLSKGSRVVLKCNWNGHSLVRWSSVSASVNKRLLDDPRVPKSWKAVVGEAEKVVGYPTSFLNLRWLLSDEFANVAMYVKKMIGTGHPILLTVRNLLLQNNAPSWGLIILLVSKAGGLNQKFPDVDCDLGAGLLHTQRVLAEVAEMLRTSNKIHKSLYHVNDTTNYKEDMYYGNKIALLCGDYLLSSSFKELANIRNQELNEIMSTALRDMAEKEFIGLRDGQNKPLPSKRNMNCDDCEIDEEIGLNPLGAKDVLGNTKAEWTLRSMLGGGSLLANACRCTLNLAKHSKETQCNGYRIGKHIALAWQAKLELDPFLNKKTGPFSLVSAPVLYHLDHNPNIYTEIECGLSNVDDVNYDYLRVEILKGPGIEHTKQLQKEHASKALKYIFTLPKSDSRLALENIVNTL